MCSAINLLPTDPCRKGSPSSGGPFSPFCGGNSPNKEEESVPLNSYKNASDRLEKYGTGNCDEIPLNQCYLCLIKLAQKGDLCSLCVLTTARATLEAANTLLFTRRAGRSARLRLLNANRHQVYSSLLQMSLPTVPQTFTSEWLARRMSKLVACCLPHK